MTGNDILNAVSETDEKYISRSENYGNVQNEFKKAKSKKIKTVSAVCLCAAVAVGAAFVMKNISTKPVLNKIASENGEASSQTVSYSADVTAPAVSPAIPEAEIYQVPHWDELSELQRFGSAEYNGTEYFTCGHEVAGEYFGETLGTATVKGFDMYTDTEYKEEVSVFAIKDVSPACAVGVKFADGVCTVYHDQDYKPATLGQFLEDCGLKKYLVFGKAYANYFDADKRYHMVKFDDFDDSAVWEQLLCDADAKNNADIERNGDNLADISADVPALGIENQGLWFTEDGYLCTNILATLKCFYIGEEKTKAFADYLYANIKYVDEAQDFSAGATDEAVTAEEGTVVCCTDVAVSSPAGPQTPAQTAVTIPETAVSGEETAASVPGFAVSGEASTPAVPPYAGISEGMTTEGFSGSGIPE